MKKFIITVLIVFASINFFGQSWSATSLDGNTYRNGNVGIGAINPAVKLQLEGSAANGTIGTEEIFKLGRASTNAVSFQQAASFKLGRWASPGGIYESYTRLDIALKGNQPTSDYNTDVTVMTFQNNGNVGIGTINPFAGIHVVKSYTDSNNDKISAILGNEYNHWTLFGGQNGGRIRGSNEGYLVIESNPNGSGDKKLYLNANSSSNVSIANGGGNVGIGTTNPSYKLDVLETANNGVKIQAGNAIADIALSIGSAETPDKFIVQAGGNVGIGTINPAVKLQLEGSAANGTIGTEEIFKLGRASTNAVSFQQAASFKLGRWASPGGIYESYTRLDIALKGNQPTSDYNTDVTVMTFQNNGNVGIGTTTPTSLLTVAGKIGSREVKVSITDGSDFVFEKDYPIRKLEEVEAFIKENKHLPEIAPASEMEENGIELGAMNIKLLQKIEELTLYLIEQNKTLKKQNEKIMELEGEIKEMKSNNN